MPKRFSLPCLLLLAGLGTLTDAMGQFTLSAEIRPRAEYRDGFKSPLPKEVEAAFFVEQRSRLSAMFSSEKFDVYLAFQDVRNWGATSQVYKSDPSLQNVYQAWAAYKISSKSMVTVGRMELDYDNVRILGNLDWAAQGRSHDLLKYQFKGERISVHVGAAFNQDALTPEPVKLAGTFYQVPGSYKTMQYAWLHKDWMKSGLSVLLLNNGVQSTSDSVVYFSQTFGFYGTRKLGTIQLEYDAYYQVGRNSAGVELSAYMFGTNATFLKDGPNNLTLGLDYLSGDRSGTAGTDEAFDPLYGTHHKFYGFMDYFYVGNPHLKKGLVDLFLRVKIKTGKKSSLSVHGHQFFGQSRITDESGADLASSLGTEVDLLYVQNLAPGVILNVGYSRMIASASLEFIKGVQNAGSPSWAWVMIGFKPTLFVSGTAQESK